MSLNPYKRSSRALAVSFVVYALLVAINLGEFWPFSIYPMFSKGGIPWSRAVVREVDERAEAGRWEPVASDELPGQAYPLLEYGVDPIDLANFISKSREWNRARVNGLRRMFGDEELDRRSLLVMRVNGRISAGDSVQVSFVPYVMLAGDTTRLNPQLVAEGAE